MRARDLAEPYPSVSTDDDAVDALRLLAERKLPALLVLDREGQPWAVVPGSQLVRQLVPDYVRTTRCSLPSSTDRTPTPTRCAGGGRPVGGRVAATAPVHAAVRRTRCERHERRRAHGPHPPPLVAVIERDGDHIRLLGAITAARLVEQLIGGS